MESTRTPFVFRTGHFVFLDALPHSLCLNEGELNLFLVARCQDGQVGPRIFLTALSPGAVLYPQPGLIHEAQDYVLAVAASTEAQAFAASHIDEEWRRLVQGAVCRLTRSPEDAPAVHDMLLAVLAHDREQRSLRQARRQNNEALTSRAVTGKLETLQNLCGFRSEAQEPQHGGDLLALALGRLALDYRLPATNSIFMHAANTAHLPMRKRIGEVAATSGWRMREVRLPRDCRKFSARPLLAFREEDGAPLVLYLDARGGKYWNPELGGDPLPLTTAMATSLSSEAWCCYEPFPAGKISRKSLIRFIFATARPTLALIVSLGLISALIGLIMPVATGYVTGKIIPTGNLAELWQLAALLVVLSACQIGLNVVPTLALSLFGAQQFERFQAAMFDHVLRIPVSAYQTCDSGDLTRRILGASQVQSTLFSIVSSQFIGSVFSLISLVMMVWYSPLLAAVGIAAVSAYALIFFVFSRMNLQPLAQAAAVSGRISGLLKQVFDGMAKIRGAGAEQQILSRFLDDFVDFSRTSYVLDRNGAALQVVTTVFPMLISVLFYGLAGGFLDKNLPLPTFLAFMAAFHNFQAGLMGLSSGCWSLLAVEPQVRRFMPLLETAPEDAGERIPPGTLDGSVEISHLSFRYAPDAPLVLDTVSLSISPGEFVAVVGPSGSGKSTLVRLLLGFERPETGAIFYSGKDLATVDLRAVRRQLGVILQGGKVLPGSILDNIITGTEHTPDDAWEALCLAALDRDVEAMPMGIHTLVTPETVSGGQQQRILIARALVGKPCLVIMDESTSALDNRTQETVTNNMEDLRMTRLVIAHRLSTIARADRIVVLDKGRICQVGTYNDLRSVDGLFKQLVERQITERAV